MILCIDCGNTNIVFGLHDGTDATKPFRLTCRMETRPGLGHHDLKAGLDDAMIKAGLRPGAETPIHGVVIASVVPDQTPVLRQFAESVSGIRPLCIGDPGIDLGLHVAMASPGEVGADRLVNAVAAHARYPGALIVLDFGTATTFDVVDEQGSYCGGVIAPGINLALDALHRAAALLPRIAVAPPPRVIGSDTVSAMQSGIYWGYLGLIEGLVHRIREERGGVPVTVIATGGLAPLFGRNSEVIDFIEPDLTLFGLLSVYLANRPRS